MKENAIFAWDRDNDKAIFPIDYSVDEFSRKLGMSSYKLRKSLLNHPVLNSLLQDMLVSNPRKGTVHTKGYTPIPLEADLFLKSFSMLNMEYDDTEVSKEQFKKLCEILRSATVRSTSDDIYSTFYRCALFQNREFCRETLIDLWERELTPRFLKLKKLAGQTSLDRQINVLMDCLQSLDRCTLNLELTGDIEPPNESDPTTASQQILKQLLRERKKGNSSNSTATYLVHNSTVADGLKMEDAFKQLSNRSEITTNRDELLQAARQAYMEDLVQRLAIPPKSQEFEKDYLHILQYLSITECQMSDDDISDIISQLCVQNCQSVIDFCTQTPCSRVTQSQTPPSYSRDLVACLVDSKMKQRLDYFKETIQLICYYSAAYSGCMRQRGYPSACIEINDPDGQLIENLLCSKYGFPTCSADNEYYSELCMFSKQFERNWRFIYKEPLFAENPELFANKMDVAEKLRCDRKEAADFFKNKSFCDSSDDVTYILDLYEKLMSNPHCMYPPIQYLEVITKLLQTSFLVVLRQIVRQVIPTVEADIKHLSSIMKCSICQESF